MIFEINSDELNVKSFRVSAETTEDAILEFGAEILYPRTPKADINLYITDLGNEEYNVNSHRITVRPFGSVEEKPKKVEAPVEEKPKKGKKVEEPVVETPVVEQPAVSEVTEEPKVAEE